eukprot:CAMPEP_0113914626 /NCGR_PEP_ID=MMETSP0780_2-20120614/30539_1 /TAXON_ID=652834 /ORGANISM="Palpitomonas bilix" /LENGTH=50 /DNA_ID=CAMNT_0000912621 /DNA_START=19 /DNA_END=167 /DNA_ORIENTATION=+ /assembly_acc=CAM_ASM_000599
MTFLKGSAYFLTRMTMMGLETITFGHDDLFEGLGIFFDSYDNDGARNNPA